LTGSWETVLSRLDLPDLTRAEHGFAWACIGFSTLSIEKLAFLLCVQEYLPVSIEFDSTN
jgi:hypothetical protein